MNWRTFTQVCIILVGLGALHYFTAANPSSDDFWRAVGSVATVVIGWAVGRVGSRETE